MQIVIVDPDWAFSEVEDNDEVNLVSEDKEVSCILKAQEAQDQNNSPHLHDSLDLKERRDVEGFIEAGIPIQKGSISMAPILAS